MSDQFVTCTQPYAPESADIELELKFMMQYPTFQVPAPGNPDAAFVNVCGEGVTVEFVAALKMEIVPPVLG